MAEEEEYEEVVEYYIEEEIEEGEPMETYTEVIETTYSPGSTQYSTVTTKQTSGTTQKGTPSAPVRKKVVRTKVDTSKFMTPYLKHSSKMQKLFSDIKYKEKFEKEKGKPYAITTDTPELRRIKKAQDQLSEVKYRMAGDLAKTDCHVDEKARDIEHAKKVSQQVSKVLYKQNWEENKEKYLLPPDAPEFVQAIKNTALFSKKPYIEDWENDKTMFYPYDDSPELRRVAQAQKALSDIVYKKGHDERKAKYTSLPDPPDTELAKKVTRQLSDLKYHEDYNKKIKGKWSQTPCYDVAVARMNADNFSARKYQEDWENKKDQIYFMQTETPEYAVNKRAGITASKVKYREDYEKAKASTDYNVLPATENPLLRHLKAAGNLVNDRLYKEAYEKAKGSSINYCDTPKYQIDSVLKNFGDVKYKEAYQNNILGRYIGSYEDPHHTHYMKVEAMKSDKNYKADYEEDKTKCYFPQTITQEYEALKKLDQCKDHTYKKHPDQIKFTQVTDSPVLVQAQINSKQLSDLNYKAKHEKEKFKCSIPPDAPFFIQSQVNAYNLSDNWYKYDWEKSKAKKFEIKFDAIPLLAAKANRKIASDVEYKKAYEQSKGKLIGALSIHDDPKMIHSLKVAKQQSDRLYKDAYEKGKGISINYCDTPKYQVDSVLKNFGDVKYKEAYQNNILGRYIGSYEDPYHTHCMKVEAMKSDKNYKADYEEDKTKCYFPQTITQEYEAFKKLDQCKDHTYKKHPDQIKFTQVTDSPVLVQAQINSKQLSDLNYKAKHESEKFKCSVPPDAPLFLQSRVNAYNLSDNWYKYDWERSKAKKFEIKVDAIPLIAAKANRKIASDVEYKKAYEQSRGKLIGALSIHDDPKMLHSQKVAKQQSDREYRKGYEESKTKYTAPLDMIPVVQAKKTQAIASNADYKHLIHNYSYPPDSINVELAKKSYALQSENEYRADYNSWMKGCGWVPFGSLDVEKAKRASDIISERKYRQHPDTLKFTSIEDEPIIVQSKINQAQRSDVLYKAKNEDIIHKYHLPADAPQFIQAKVNSYNISDTYYKLGLEELKTKGYDLRNDAIPIKAAKAARHAASDFQYKKDYERAKGKLIGFQSLQDDPKLVHYMNVAKMQSEREYRKGYEKSKTKYNTPLDMVNVVAAKKAQEIASNTNYKHLVHHYSFLPGTMSVELSKNMMQIQSDNLYKSDFNSWMKGIGWIPIGSLDVEKARKAGEALNEKNYRQHPDTIKFTSVVDSPVMVQAKQNALQLSDRLYKSSGEELKHKYNLPADAPQFIQAKYNAANISDTYYKLGYQDLIAKGHHVLGDSIPITLAKASRNIASDFKYKEAYEKARGKHVGFRSLQDDPKLVHSMHVAKMQSDREYRKGYEKSKTSYHTPVEMVSIQAAKQAQDVASNSHYKHLIHRYTCLPDAMSVELARNRMQIQSDNLYKQDYNSWFKGIGWSPLGSLDVEKAKKAGEALDEHKYRQHPDTFRFTSLPDSMPMVLAKQNTKQLSDINYKVEGEKVKHTYHLDPDLPQFIQARVNAYNISDGHYKADWKKLIAKGYDLKPDAISIIAAKASRNIASNYKYKEAYEKDKGKQVGFRSLQDDPKLVHYMNVAKLQSDRLYKKDYEISKLKYHTPVDMFSVTAAKKAQEVVTDSNYRQYMHNYTLLPDAMSMALSRNRMQIQSDNLYRADFSTWLRGIGWVPIQSLEVEKAKKATDILSERKYRQHPDKLKYTLDMDSMEQVLAKQNATTMNKRLYVDKWNKEKTEIHVMPDTPEILLSKANQVTMSNKLYKAGWEEDKKKGYDLKPDAISIKAAKASRDIASDYKYKLAFEQAKGKHIGFRSLEDDPKLVHFMQVAKMQSEREYKKDYEKSKTRFHTPVDMFSVVAAKKAQEVVTDTNYRNIIHTYNVMPDSMNLELAKNMMQIQSNNQYKADYDEFMKGVGWIPLGSLEAEKNKKAMEIVSDTKYRQHPDKLKYSILMDSMPMVLATNNAKIIDEHLYKKDWEADKTKIHIMPDIPEILLAKANAFNISNKMYKLSLEEAKKKGYDLRADAIPIQAAKASRDIASDYKYKLGYEKDKGKLVGFRSLQDDPKLVHYMQVAKMQSDREYRKAYEISKTRYNTPADTFSVMAAKEAQANITNMNYKKLIHKYILLPDSLQVEQTRNMNRIQSDHEYKQDYNEWYKGLGWSPAGSLDVEKSKKATEIASDTKYRQHPSAFPFTKKMDSMDMELAKYNAGVMDKHAYIQAWEKDKTTIHVMPDTPDIMLAKANKFNYSEKLYKLGWQEMIKKGYDLTAEAISVKAAKASRDIASEYKYKEGYRKQQGHHIGFRNVQDDPKLVHCMNVAKMQSEREYKRDFEKWKTKVNLPVDMIAFLAAKNCQHLVSDADYRRIVHQWTCLPDQTDVIHAKKVYELQSNNAYKADLQWLQGVGWNTYGSLESETNKKASEILSDKKYRQHPDTIKFTSIADSMEVVLAKENAKHRSDKLYREAWDKDKTQIHIMPDTPEIILARANLFNTSDKLYKLGLEELKKKGYNLPIDAITIKAAKASRDIASEYKYKDGYRKQLGHHIGARSIQDDPKLVHSMNVAKMQSEREYKKDFEKWKTKYNTPVDMLGILLAKNCQKLVTDIDYRNYLHQWTCLPDQNDVVHARKTYELQSDNAYKADLEWLKGIGWSPSGSLEAEKNKRASQILSDHTYRQHPDTLKFTSPIDSMPMALAKHNSEIMNQRMYVDAWNKDKTSIHIMPDTPEILLSQQNKINFSEKLYKLSLEEARRKGYDLRVDAIPIKAAKASRDIASDYKYKEGYRKQLGHHVGARSIQDDPKLVHSMNVGKMQSEREYKKDFEKSKTKYTSPVDMLGVLLAKNCQKLVSDVDYRNYLHQWTCLPDQNDVIHARKTYDLQSDNYYKLDLQWMKGIGWVPIGSLDVEKAKKAGEILSEKKYRQPPDRLKFTSVTDSLEVVLAKHNAETMSKRLYTEAWDKDKTQIHMMPDTPEITLARENKINYSESLYKRSLEEARKKGYDLRIDAIPIQAAKASRNIASDYKYKEGYRKQLGHHVGARSVQDDPKLVHSMNVAKMQSEREYKKDFEKSKTRYTSPVDMLGVLLAKNCQKLVSDIDYRHYLHQWTCLPDQNDVIQARKAYELQSDNYYKLDLQWMKGIGWVPIGSLDTEKARRAADILSEKKYRQPPDSFKFTSVTDSLEMALAKQNAEIMNKRLYTEAWDTDKRTIHVMPDTPEIMLAKFNKLNYSEKLYKLAMEESKKKGYDLRVDAIAIQAAKASRNIASDYKYKEGYRKQLGHHVGARSVQDDPKLVHSMNVAKMQSEREYKKDFEKLKTKYVSPVDMLGVLLAKNCQKLVSDIDYRHYLHQWTCLPDQNDVIQARKAYDLQSDAVYKSDMEWLKGVGWIPVGSLEVEKVKKAGEILSDKKYRQPPDTIKFTSVTDSLEIELAKHNAETMNKRLYTEAWDKDKTTIHVMPDTPEILLAKANSANISHRLYIEGWEEAKKKGYDLRPDAISIVAAKASRNIASDYKYKQAYEKQRGHYIGVRKLQEDPKLVWFAHVAKMQSDREYKKDFEKWKTKIHSPVDMLSVLLAKNCQKLVSDVDYRRHLHEWTCLPDQNDVIHAKKVYELQSENAYKADLEWLRGIGWVPQGSLEVLKVKKAQEILNDRLYRQRPDSIKFTAIVDPPEIVLAKSNALLQSGALYRELWDKEKTQFTLPVDTPEMVLSKMNALNISKKQYQSGWEEAKKKGYDLRLDAIAIQHAKASRNIVSEYKYKEGYRKQLGHHVGCRDIYDDPKLVLAMHVAKLQSDRVYKKDFEKWKTKFNSPVDMLSILLAKNCQKLVSDIDYRHYLHQWTCLPDQNDVIQAKKVYELQSDAVYKSDLEWLRGVGWVPHESVEVKRVKAAQDILNERLYRTPPDRLKFTNIVDSPEIVLAKINAEQLSRAKYREVWDKDKTMIHVMPDTPEIMLSRANAVNVSNKLYREAWDDIKKFIDLRSDAVPIKTAKASREIVSDYKYKEGYRKQLGHHVGCRNIYDDPKLVLAMHVAKLQSDRVYKKDFEKWKTKFNSPVDMLSILLAKNCQKLVSDIDYRRYLHEWTCLPDQNDVIQAKKAYELQSDAVYKSDLEWIRGIGWMPNDSVVVNHVKNAQDILSERKYRTKVDSQKFTPVADRVDYVTAKQSGEILSDIKYHQEWNNVKTNYTLTETPQLEAAKEAARILNHHLYKDNWEKQKATGYFLPPDSVAICHAKHSNKVQSELKYKADHVKQRGHYVGVQNMRQDPKLVWFEHAGKIQNDRLYKDAYNKTKTKIHIPPDILSVIAAKDCQTVVSEIPYRTYLHEWTCHPDQNDCIQARKAYDLQSDNIYKSDLEWIRGCGWIPLDSVEHKKVRNAQDLINKRIYTKDAIDNFSKFTVITDPPDVVLAKVNSVIQSDLKYKETFNLEKGHYIGSEDTIALNHSRDVSKLYSDILYKDAWESGKAIGYTLPPDYIPIVGAKHADYVNSELKYKLEHEKQKGHYLAGTQINDFPSVVHSLAFQKIRSALAYRKNYEDTKAHIHIPSDMINHVLAKKCQYILSDLEYRTRLHQWNCSPEEHDVIMAKRAQEILSDVLYKDDLTWLKGIGCYVWDTPEILHAKKSYDLQSQLKYTKAGKENFKNYGIVLDTPVYVTALQSSINASDLKYKEEYHKTKDQYTTVLETVDHERTENLKHLFSNNLYKEAWEKVKAASFTLPPDAVPFVRAKELKHNASIVKYREEYDKFKALYTIPKGIKDDPNTERCLKVGKLNIDRLYRETYEKNKAKIHIVPDMVDIVSAKDTQKKVSEIDYRIRIHEWANIADPHAHAHARKVNDQLSDIVYKDDLNWLKGIGCFVWDTPEILHAKHAYNLRNDIKYKSKAEKMKSNYTVVTDTPVYVQNVLSGMNLSDAVYHHDYIRNIKGKYTPVDKTVDLERANNAYKIQSEGLYRNAGLHALPTGYTLPADTPGFKHAKHAQYIGSYLKYKEVYEHIKDKGYNFGPKAVPFVNIRKVNKVLNERLYRETYHKNKDKIHTTPDTPEIRQVKATQEAVSDLIYKTDFFKMQGHMISLPFTPQTVHSRYVGEITSDIKYKGDLEWLKGLGCFLYDTPDMIRARHLRNLWSHYVYTNSAKKLHDKYRVVLDTPVYRTIQELKTHLSDIVYRAVGNEQKTKYTSILDTPDFHRAKTGQKLQSKYLYAELATKERPHHHAGDQTPALQLAKHVKDFASEKKYKSTYEKMKHKYVTVPDTPILIRAKKAYVNASDLRYKETFEKAKGKYHTVKDALDIVYHRKVTDDISKVKYKEKYVSQLGIWRSIPDRPDHFHHRAVTDAVSDFKYKEDLTWLKGIGCYAWDTPDLVLAGKNKALYSPYKYKELFEKIKSKFKYVADNPVNNHLKYATQLMNEKLYKSDYEKKKDKYSIVVDDPRTLLAKLGGELSSQYKYKKLYEKQKDKFTSVVDTPEHLRTTKVNKQISEIIYKMEHVKAKAKGYTTIHDTPMLLHARKVKDRISDLKYKELYQQNKSHCNVVPDSVHIKAAKQAYKVNSNLDYKKKYEATKAHWHWTVDRPDFIQNAKTSLQQSDYDYKYDQQYYKGCKISVTDDKNTVLALQNAILASDLKYKEKHNKERGTIHPVPDTPQVLLAKTVSALVSENKYKEHVKKHLPHGSFTKLPETRDTVHVKEVTKNVSETNYKKKFQKEKGKSNYSIMLEPPDVKHAMEVAKNQSNIQYKKDAKSKLHYTSVADRPDIKKASQVSKLVSDIQYKAKARGEAGMGVSMLGRPDIELAKEVSRLTSQIKYKENFDKEKGKKPRYDLKESKIYKTLQDAHHIASEVKYKADLKKLHKPVTDMSESLSMNHVLGTSQLASSYQYKKQYEKSKGHYHVVPDNLEQLHLKEASELQSQVKYKEKYEKERGKPMLDFETPTYLTAKEAQHMQSEKEYKKDFEESIKGRNLAGLEITPSLLHVRYATKIASEKEYRRDLEEGVKGKGLTILEETPDLLRAKNATQILNEKEYKKTLELEIKGRGLTALALGTPDFMRAKNAMDIASQIKYKQSAEMEKANYTTVVDTPEIIHANQVRNLSSQKKYKEEAERTMSYYVPVLDTPEMQRVRENQKNFSMLQYQQDMQHSKGKVTVVNETPEILRVKENQKNFSTILYKEDIGTGTAIEKTPEMQRIKQTQDAISTIKYKENIGKGTPIPDLPEVKRVKETQKHISSVLYKEDSGQGTPIPVTPEIERVKRNQENISSVTYKENVGTGTATPVTPEMERVKRNQENVSLVLYKENLGTGIPTPITPDMERVKCNQQNVSSVLYKEPLGAGIPTPVTPETERAKHNQEIFSSVLYKENVGKSTPIPVTPEMERVKRSQEHISSVLYKEELGKGTPTPVTPEMERVKRNQEHISSVLYKEGLGKGTPIPVTPEMERVKHNQEHISSVLYKEGLGKGTPTPVTPEMERVKRNQEYISSVLYKEGLGKGTPTPVTPEMERVKRNQEHISSVLYKENMGQATPTPITPEMERAKRNQENISLVLYKENLGKGTPTTVTPEMERAKRNQENISSVLYSDSFRKQVQGKAAFVLDTPEMRRVRETQRHISTVKYHEDFEKSKGSFTPVVTDPITERVKKNMHDFSDISYRGIQRKVVEIERKRVEQDQELNNLTDLRVWRTNPGSVFDYDPAEDNIQSRSLHLITVQAQRRSREQSRSASALSLSAGDEKSEPSENADQHLSYYSNGGFFTATTTVGYKQAKTVELPQQRSSSVATQQTTVSSIPSQPSTAGKTYRAMYDYMAADADEVSFKDGDTIMNVQAIDEGWMYGTVQRTGKTGMLPANYVEAV
ncbi:nebulin isoform X4 [Heteronotia binoei]|uniref:nebulin isoform X4 n=1 Tax=Heteronotia binoei TaxID=13085 RepID=UPI0029307014|nr:nebulin isoform X4 [Heteronotia binoei]